MQESALLTTSERLGKDRVKLRVEVPEAALGPAIDAAYRKWANEIKVPGFRKGRIPKPIIDARVGLDAVREEALNDALPDFYSRALEAEDLEALAPPDIDVIDFEAGSPLVFEAIVDVRPEVVVPDIAALQIEAPSSEVSDEDVDEQLQRLRDRVAELETVFREAQRGDYVLIDLRGYRHDQPVEGASAPDLLYEVGSRSGPPKLDDELQGTRPGAILKFTDTMPEASGEVAGQEISFTVLVKEVKMKKLPPLDDEFAKTVGEFDSLDELKDDLRARLQELRAGFVEEEISRRALNELVAVSDLEAPEKLVDSDVAHRWEHFEDELKTAGLTLDQYAQQMQVSALEVRSDLRAQATASVKAELLLEQIARDQGIEVTREDIAREVTFAAARSDNDPKELAERLTRSGQLMAVAGDIMRRRALEYVVENMDVIGRPARRSTVEVADPSGSGTAGAEDTGRSVEAADDSGSQVEANLT